MQFLKNIWSKIYEILPSGWVGRSLFNLLILVFFAYIFYRFLFSKKGAWIRERFEFLKKFGTRDDVKQLIRDGEFARAGEILLSANNYNEAIKVFTKGHLYGRAADVYLIKNQIEQAANLYEKAQDYLKAADLLIGLKLFERAEKCLEKTDRIAEIPGIYLKNNLKSLAAQSMIKLGQFKEASELFAQDNNFQKAGDLLFELYIKEKRKVQREEEFHDEEKLKNIARAAGAHFVKAKNYDRASEILLEEKLYREAALAYEGAGMLEKASELHLKSGDYKKAAQILRDGGDAKKAAFIEAEGLSLAGDDVNALKHYQEAGSFAKAGDIYRNLEEHEKAAIMYEKGQEYLLAASAYVDAKIFDRAAICAEKGKDFDKAAEYYGLAGDNVKQVALLEKLNNHYAAAVNYYGRGLSSEAMAALGRIGQDSPDFSKAQSLSGKILLERGEFSKAREKLELATKGEKKITRENIEAFSNMAVLEEQSNNETGLLKTIEKMLLDDLVDNEVKDKVSNLKQKLSYFAISRLSKLRPLDGQQKFSDPKLSMFDSSKQAKLRYIKIKEIGRGGMGIVYTAKDSTLDRTVALKILPSTLKKNPQAVKIFLREAKSAAALNHPNIVTVFDAGMEDEEYYIAMELINGLTIKEILQKNKKLTLKSTLEVLRQLLKGLGYAHSRNIVHRDLTTNNIMWSREKVVKIMDFGLAKVVKDLLSEQSIIGGTPSFMSPEQTLGKPIDHRTDIYSVGICLYQMLLGELPFKKGDIGYHHIHTQPPNPQSLDKNIPDELNSIILKCLEKDPLGRFQAVEEIDTILHKKILPSLTSNP